MKLAVSNLAWNSPDENAARALLCSAGVTGIEVAPTRIASWPDLDSATLRQARQEYEDAGLSVPALQAIFFGVPGVSLLGPDHQFGHLLAHLERVCEVANTLGARRLVYGAPGTRKLGQLTPVAAWGLGLVRMARIARVVAAAGCTVVLEPVPTAYGAEFITSPAQALAMVTAVDSPGLALHLDTGCALLGGDDIGQAIQAGAARLAYFHAAEPRLGQFADPQAQHLLAAQTLQAVGYEGWISIEMRPAEEASLLAVEQAVSFVRRTYGAVRHAVEES